MRMVSRRTMKQFILSNDFDSFWKAFTRIFQTLCVSHYFIFRKNLRNRFLNSLPYLIYFIIFTFLHISMVILTTSKGFQEKNSESELQLKHKQSQLMYYVNSLSIFGSYVTHFAIHLETFFCVKQEEEIYDRLKLINDIFETKLNHVMDYRKRFFCYVKNVVGIFVFTIILAATSSIISEPDFHDDIEIHFMKPIHVIAVIIIRSRWCYIALLLYAIADILNELQILLREQQLNSFRELTEESQNNSTREKIRYFREIYSNIWFIIALMSDCFGWSLLTFLIEMTFEVINASYWFYINLHLYESTSLNIRKIKFSIFGKLFLEKHTFFLCRSIFISDIILYNSSLVIMFWYFCMISEKCQNMVRKFI